MQGGSLFLFLVGLLAATTDADAADLITAFPEEKVTSVPGCEDGSCIKVTVDASALVGNAISIGHINFAKESDGKYKVSSAGPFDQRAGNEHFLYRV